ncbi:ABC transporter permease [candidate division NPL-UPA2 bacterium]|nr:ABC transporter permease [candidate division NPL-UPA2 bacterium]
MLRYARNPLVRYCARRLAFAGAAFGFFVIIIFVLPRAIPGNPISVLLSTIAMQGTVDPDMISAVHAKFMEEFGLGKPMWEQFFSFIAGLFKGDLGTSITFFPRSVTEIILQFLPWTLALLLPAVTISWLLGNHLGALIARKRQTFIDNLSTPIFVIISQTPLYWLAMLVLFVFAVHLRIAPMGGTHSWYLSPALTWTFTVDYLRHYMLPFFTLVIIGIGGWAIGMRSMMIYELGSDYINFADTLGLPDRKLQAYAFRSAMLPQITGLAVRFGLLLGGSIILELVFNYRGMGYITFRALTTLDYPLIQGVFIILIATVILANLAVDITYGFIDPRIKTGSQGG